MKKQFIYEKKRVVVLLFLTITASLTWYVSKKNTINEAMHNLDLPDSGFSLDEAKINITNQTGQLMISILAEKAYEEPLNRVLNLDNIYIVYHPFSERNNIPNEFENALSDKINNGEVDLNENHWEDFSEKLNNSNLTAYERTVKETLNSEKISYNNSHWKALEKMLHGD